MKKLFGILALCFLLSSPASAANVNIDGLPAAASVAGANLFECEQAGTNRQCTGTQLAAFIYGLMNGDATSSGTGGVALKNTGPGATGPIGSGTTTPVVTIDAQGRITALSSATIAPPFSAVTGNWTLAQGPQGIANSIWINPTGSTAAMQNLAIPACANDGAHGLVYVNGTGLACASITGSGAVGSVTGTIGVTCSPTTGSVVCSAPAMRRDNTATTDTITSTDKGTIISENNASSVAVAITTAGFVTTDFFTVKNLGAGVATYTPSSGTIDSATTLACKQNQSADLYFDGTNYKSLSNTCGQGMTIASGTAALGTSLITSGACGSATTVAATGVATTDTITVGFNGDPTAVTGYTPAAMLTLIPYPTSGNVNIKQCNLTGSSITPSALTLNFRVMR